MSFQVAAKGATADSNAPTPSAQDARSRAIARLTQNPQQSQQEAVANPNQVSPEEMTAIRAPSDLSEAVETRQKSSSEEPATDEAKEVSAPAKVEEPISKQYAILARKEKALRANFQQFKAEQEAFKAERAQLTAERNQVQAQVEKSYKERLANDPIGMMTEAGLTPDQITNIMLNPPRIDPTVQREIDRMRAEVKALKDEQEAGKKSQGDAQSTAYKQAVNQIRLEAKQLVDSDPNFEMTKETGSIEDVVSLIEQTFKEDGILLSVEEAAKEVEEHLIQEALKLAKIKKFQQKLSSSKQSTSEQALKAPQSQQMKTLTNNISSTPKLSARDRAILAFKGENRK